MVIYEVNIVIEIQAETQADVNKAIKEITDKLLPEEGSYIGRFGIEFSDVENDDEEGVELDMG